MLEYALYVIERQDYLLRELQRDYAVARAERDVYRGLIELQRPERTFMCKKCRQPFTAPGRRTLCEGCLYENKVKAGRAATEARARRKALKALEEAQANGRA